MSTIVPMPMAKGHCSDSAGEKRTWNAGCEDLVRIRECLTAWMTTEEDLKGWVIGILGR